MGKCKNPNCNEETNNKNIYCSLKCRNIYVNKYIRDYDKNKDGLNRLRIDNIEKYNKSPKICKNCGVIIPYDKRLDNVGFCCHSCSALFNNKNRKGLKYNFTKKGMDNLTKIKKDKEYNEEDKKCKNCNEKLTYKQYLKKNIFCSDKCRHEYDRIDNEKYSLYKLDCNFKFDLKNYPEEFDLELYKKHGVYKAKNRGDNQNGVSRDHMFSINDGFKNNVSPLILSHPANCKLMLHKDNMIKWKNSSVTFDELLERIEKWNKKYGDLAQ